MLLIKTSYKIMTIMKICLPDFVIQAGVPF